MSLGFSDNLVSSLPVCSSSSKDSLINLTDFLTVSSQKGLSIYSDSASANAFLASSLVSNPYSADITDLFPPSSNVIT